MSAEDLDNGARWNEAIAFRRNPDSQWRSKEPQPTSQTRVPQADPSTGISRGREQPQDVVASHDRPSVGASGHSSHWSGRSRARAVGRDAVGRRDAVGDTDGAACGDSHIC
jgi:hypothetical protein